MKKRSDDQYTPEETDRRMREGLRRALTTPPKPLKDYVGKSAVAPRRKTGAKKLKAGGKPYPDVVDSVLPLHDLYWKTEAAMAEGNPVLALERGEQMEMPPVLYLQGSKDVAHPRPDLDRFVAGYRKAGGQVELEIYEGEGQAFITRNPGSPAAAQATEKIIEFVHKQIR